MKKIKRNVSLLLAALTLGSSAALSACKGGKVKDTDQTLEIYAYDVGYGVQWCHDMVALFKEQEWVKEKYPELYVSVSSNDLGSYATTRFSSPRNNTIDLFFSLIGRSHAGKDSSGKYKLENLTESVYNSLVPGEEITVKDKMFDSFVESMEYVDPNDDEGKIEFYYTPWAGGNTGIIYNVGILEQFGISVPNTTNELIAACDTIMENKGKNNGKYNLGYSFMQSKEATNYFDYLFPVWWAQYEGVDGYYNFYNGIDRNTISKNIFKQTGRLSSLKVLEQILDYDNGYLSPKTFTTEFMPAQTMVMQGASVFHVNGDWFDDEMWELREDMIKDGDEVAELKMMKTPIVSDIIEKCPSIENDAELSALVTAIDAKSTALSGTGYEVEQADYNRVKAAREVTYSNGPAHTSVIPSYATGKAVAIDFLRFMATDIALDSYVKSTHGAHLPYEYNVKEKNPELYASLSEMQQEKFNYFYSDFYNVSVLPSITSYSLVYYGGVGAFADSTYIQTFVESGNKKTAQKFYDETITYWTDTRWTNALDLAGIAR